MGMMANKRNQSQRCYPKNGGRVCVSLQKDQTVADSSKERIVDSFLTPATFS